MQLYNHFCVTSINVKKKKQSWTLYFEAPGCQRRKAFLDKFRTYRYVQVYIHNYPVLLVELGFPFELCLRSSSLILKFGVVVLPTKNYSSTLPAVQVTIQIFFLLKKTSLIKVNIFIHNCTLVVFIIFILNNNLFTCLYTPVLRCRHTKDDNLMSGNMP